MKGKERQKWKLQTLKACQSKLHKTGALTSRKKGIINIQKNKQRKKRAYPTIEGCPCQRYLCSSSKTETSSRPHLNNKVNHQKKQVGRHRGKTAKVEGICHSCKNMPLQPHYWEKAGLGITQKRLEHHHHASRQREMHHSAKHSGIPHQRHWSAQWY